MKLYTIWANDDDSFEGAWLEDAWDEYSYVENREGFEIRLSEASATGDVTRVIVLDVPDADLERAWYMPTVDANVVPTAEAR